MIKYFSTIVFLLISLGLSAQPLVITCTLETVYTRDGVREARNSGVICRDCRVAIKVVEDGRALHLDGLFSSASYWKKRDDELDSNGFGGRSTWRITSDEVSAREEKFAYGKKNGYASLTISRLTGSFYSIDVVKNPIGNGNIEEKTSGECQAAKAAF